MGFAGDAQHLTEDLGQLDVNFCKQGFLECVDGSQLSGGPIQVGGYPVTMFQRAPMLVVPFRTSIGLRVFDQLHLGDDTPTQYRDRELLNV